MNSERNAPRPLGRDLPQFRVTRLRERYPGTGFQGFKKRNQPIEIWSLSTSKFCLAGTALSKKIGDRKLVPHHAAPTGAHLHHGYIATQTSPARSRQLSRRALEKDREVQPWPLECSHCPKAERRQKNEGRPWNYPRTVDFLAPIPATDWENRRFAHWRLN
jgi:hypothetical protein